MALRVDRAGGLRPQQQLPVWRRTPGLPHSARRPGNRRGRHAIAHAARTRRGVDEGPDHRGCRHGDRRTGGARAAGSLGQRRGPREGRDRRQGAIVDTGLRVPVLAPAPCVSDSLFRRGLRPRREAQHPPLTRAMRIRRHARAGGHARGSSARTQAGRGLPQQWSRGPGGSRLRRDGRPRPRREVAGIRHLPRPPDPGPGAWRSSVTTVETSR